MWRKSKSVLTAILVAAFLLSALPLASAPVRAQDGIEQSALLHDSRDTLYRTPGGAVPTESTVTLRLRAAAGDLDSVQLRLFDAMEESQQLIPMSVAATTPDGYDLWEVPVDVGRQTTVYWYRFILSKGGETLYYEDDTRPDGGNTVASREGGSGAAYAQSPDLSYQITVYDPEFYTPEWMRNAIIYQIFPDRFRNGDAGNDPVDGEEVFYGSLPLLFHETWNEEPVDGRATTAPSGEGYYNSDFYGGDLAGVIEKLDYLQDLGVTAIYFNPIFEARSNHRYDTADFKAIDPYLGDMETFETLVQEADARGITVILDGVFNHLSSDSVFFDRYHRFYGQPGACEELDSPYRDWFLFIAPRLNQPDACVDNPDGATYYTSWAGFDTIPKIDSSQIGPREYFFLDDDSVARTWGAAGISGWRLDVAGDIDPGGRGTLYWEAFRSVVRQVDPEAVIIGEEWGDASRWLLGKEWDSTMNYRLRSAILGFVRDEQYTDNDSNGDRIIYALTPSEADASVCAIEEDYPPMAYHALMNLLDSHDTSRLFFVVGDDPQLQKLAALFQYTMPGAPTVYYGDEIAIDAPSIPDSGGNLQDDPYNRAPYPWSDTDGDAYPAPDEDMLAYYQQLGALRHANPALREGAMITLLADDASGIYAFLRTDAASGNAAVVVLNNSADDQTVDLAFGGLLPTGLTLESTFGSDAISTDDGGASVTVAANSGDVWTATADAPFVAPEPPTGLSAEGSAGSVTLSWDAVDDASGYIVYRSPVAAGGFEPVSDAPVTDTTFVDATVANGFRYFYTVAAVGEDGLVGAQGESAQAIPAATIDTVTYVVDGAPATEAPAEPLVVPLTVGATVDIQAAITITGVTDADGAAQGVLAEAALVPAGGDLAAADWTPMTYAGELGGADVYSATLAPVEAGDYEAVARFSTNAGESWTVATYGDGTFPQVTVQASDDTTAPGAPASLTVARATLSGVILNWEPSVADDLNAYRVYRSEDGGEQTLLAEIPMSEGATYTDKAVAEGTDYTYAVTAVDSSLNESDPALAEGVSVTQGMVPVVFNVTVPETTEGDVYLAGSFGTSDYPSWDPAGLLMEQVDDTHWTLTLQIPEGARMEYKFVRGSWDQVEKGPDCEEVANRQLTATLAEGEDTLATDDTVAKWRDLDACG